MRSRTQTITLIFLGFLILTGTFGAGFATSVVIQRHLKPSATEPETFGLFWEAWGLVERDFHGELPSGNRTHLRGDPRLPDHPRRSLLCLCGTGTTRNGAG